MDRIDELLERSKRNIFAHELMLSEPVNATRALRDASRRKRRFIVGSSLATGALLVMGFANPSFFHIGKTFNLLASSAFNSKDDARLVLGYGQKVNQSTTSQGITLTIGNVYADSTKLELDMVESFSARAPSHPVIADSDISLTVDGMRKLHGISGGEFRAASGGQYAGIVYYPVMNDRPYQPLPTNFTLNVHVGQIGDVKGNWDFSISVSSQKLQEMTKVFHPNVSITHEGTTFSVQDVSVSPAETTIHCTFVQPENQTTLNLASLSHLSIKTQDGQGIGGPIVSRSNSTLANGDRITHMTVTAVGTNTLPHGLIISPVVNLPSHTATLSGNYPMTIGMGVSDSVQVTGVDYRSNETFIHLIANGSQSVDKNIYRDIQFELIHEGSAFVGMQNLTVDGANPNVAVAVFPKVSSGKTWTLESYGMTTVSGFGLTVPLTSTK